MRTLCLTAMSVLVIAQVAVGAPEAEVSSQGLILHDRPGGSGELDWNVRIVEGPEQPFRALVDVCGPDGSRHVVRSSGEAFFVSRLGLVIAIQRPETTALLASVVVKDLVGNELWRARVHGLAGPVLSEDGTSLAYLDEGGTSVLDLRSFTVSSYPKLSPFALGVGGSIAGVCADPASVGSRSSPPGSRQPLEDHLTVETTFGGALELLIFDAAGAATHVPLEGRPLKLAWRPDGALLILQRHALSRLVLDGAAPVCSGDGVAQEMIFASPDCAELRDVAAADEEILVGLRRAERGVFSGELVAIHRDGRVLRRKAGPRRLAPAIRAPSARGIPWPLAPDAQHEVGNTYGEYQNYGGSPYLHPGVDVMGDAGDPVYAVAPGVVKAVLTTSGQWHWRVAIADSQTSGTSTGYLYAHLNQASIVHSVGDTVAEGDYLGDLVTWPTAGFHHCHFARIEDEGAQWDGSWMATDNPHTDFGVQTEDEPPVFEPARGTDLLAFCVNQTSTYLEPDALSGQVDIIAHVGDTIESNWVCTVQEIRYTIYPAGYPAFPVVDDKLAVNFDMALDTYIGGPIDPFLVDLLYKQDSTCRTQGNYDFREFYHIITNSDGNETYETSDFAEALDTTCLPDADYVVRVTALDAAGNAAVDSMLVTTANGNPTTVPDAISWRTALARPFPNPTSQSTTLSYSLASRGRVQLSVYTPSGRLVKTLLRTTSPVGTHAVTWDLTDSSGTAVSSGLYMVRLVSEGSLHTRKLIVAR